MANWLKKLGVTAALSSAVLLLAFLVIYLQGVQYFAALTGNGFAKELPALDAYLTENNNGELTCNSEPVNILTFNVEYGSAFIEAMATRFRNGSTGGALPWSVRAPEIAARIAGFSPDLIGLQETHTDADIASIVPLSEYTLVNYRQGDFQYGDAALLFKTAKFSLLDQGQLWLGRNPKLPMSFGFRVLAMIRYVNWAVLRQNSTGFTFLFVNTHFDNARVNKEPSADLFREKIASLAKGMPVIVTGDFNTTATSNRYQRFTGREGNQVLLWNAYELAGSPDANPKYHPDQRIDHILAGGPCPIKSELWFIDPRPLHNGQRMSDHDPIVTRLRFTN